MSISMEENGIIEILENAEEVAVNDDVVDYVEEAIKRLLVMFNNRTGTDNTMKAVRLGRENGYADGYKQGFIDGKENGFNRGIKKGIGEMEKLYNRG